MPLQMQGPQAPQKPVQFTDEQILAMANYVQSVAPGPDFPDPEILDGEGDVARGAELFRINCAMCHNVAGAGGALTEGKYAPALTEVSALHIYAAMVTGPQNMPVFNNMYLTDEDKRDIISSLLRVGDLRKQGITLTSVGFGIGAYNDAMMEQLANRGDGQYVFVDSAAEAKRIETVSFYTMKLVFVKHEVSFEKGGVHNNQLTFFSFCRSLFCRRSDVSAVSSR